MESTPVVARSVTSSSSVSRTVRFELTGAGRISTGTGPWTPTNGEVTLRSDSRDGVEVSRTVTLYLRGVRANGLGSSYRFGLPHGLERGNGENPIRDLMLVTDLPAAIVDAAQGLLGGLDLAAWVRERTA
jgi:hypothetical protein